MNRTSHPASCFAPAAHKADRHVLFIAVSSAVLYALTWLLEAAINGDVRLSWRIANRGGGAESATVLFAAYAVVTVTIGWLYHRLIRLSGSTCLSGRARALALTAPIILNVAFLACAPRLSQDTLSYLAHGLLAQLPDANPLLTPVEALREYPPGRKLIEHGWQTWPGITPYGILWTRIEVFVAWLCGDHVSAAQVAFKCIAASASLASARLIWNLLGRLDPAAQLAGTLAYLWNPLVLIQFAGEGHNDALLILLSLLAFTAVVTARPAVSLVAQALGVMSKYITVVLLPTQLAYLWRIAPDRRRWLLSLAGAAGLSSTVLLVLYVPFWAGVHSLDGLLERQYPFGSATFFAVIRWAFKHSPLRPHSGQVAATLVASLFLAMIGRYVMRVKTPVDLAESWAWIALAFLLIVSPDYWSWYACLPVAWFCVGALRRWFWLVVALSMAGRLTDPLDLLRLHGYLDRDTAKSLTTGIGSLLPLLVLIGTHALSRLPRPARVWLKQRSAV